MLQKRPVICFNTIFGQITLESPYLWKKATGSSTPLLEVMGISHHGRSEAVNRALSDFGSEESFGQAAKRFTEHYHYALQPSTVSRVTKQIADEAFEYVEQTLSEAEERAKHGLGPHEAVEQMLIEVDGCEIRTAVFVPSEEAHDRPPAASTPKKQKQIQWREVRLGLARPLDDESTLYVGKKGAYPEVVNDVFQAAVLQGFTPSTQVIGVADGGIGLKEELERRFPGMQFILDKPHFIAHFYDTAEELGMRSRERAAWVTSHMDLLDSRDVSAVKQVLEDEYAARPHDRLRRLIGYIERFADAVDYTRFREQGYPIGSGEIESAHRAIPQKRLKLPGACWHPDSVNPMLALRIVRANDWWEDFWKERVEKILAS